MKMMKIICVIEMLLSAMWASAAPYVGAYEADNLFPTITSNEMEVLRSKKILFASRSFGLNMRDGLQSLQNSDPMYNILDDYNRYDVMNNGLSIIPTNAFDSYNFVHFLATYWPHSERLDEVDTLLRDEPYSFAGDVDVVMVYYHYALSSLFDTYTNTMDQLQADYPDIKFVYVTAGFMDTNHVAENTESAAFNELVRAKYKGNVPLYDLGYILNNDDPDFLGYLPEYSNDPAGVHPNTDFAERRMGKAFLVMLRDLFFESSCTNTAPPTVPGSLSGSGLSDSSIQISWEASTHDCDIARYEVARDGVVIGTTHATNYIDTGLSEATSYDYSVRAYSMLEIASAYSSTATVSTLADSTPPLLQSAAALSSTQVSVEFSEALDPVSAGTAANYSLDNGASVVSASLSGSTVTLSTSELTDGGVYTLTVNNVKDASSGANPVAANSQTAFTYQFSPYPDDPTLYWPMDGTLDDISSNALHGTWADGPASYAAGLLGQGISMDGTSTSSWMRVDGTTLLDGLPSITVSVWAKKDDPAVGGQLFKRHTVYDLEVTANGLVGYGYNADGIRTSISVSSAPGVNSTNWHHYALVYDGANLMTYVDGQQQSSGAMSGDLETLASTTFYVGEDPWGVAFAGQLDEMKIFHRPLATNELAALYSGGIAGHNDRAAVRAILDANGLTNKTVDAVSVYENDRIVRLYLQEAGVHTLTSEIGQLSELTMLHLYGDRALGYPLLTEVAPELGNCTKLNELLLSQNSLTNLPSAITNLTQLTICSIGDNYMCDGTFAWEGWADTVDPDWRDTQICGGAPMAQFSMSPSSGYAPLAVTFTDSSVGTITGRFWDFGDGATTNTTATTVYHTYTSAGTNTVQLIVSGPDGTDTNTQVNAVTVNEAVVPTAGFSADPQSGFVPLTVTFTDTSTGTIAGRNWNFGDGTITNTTATTVEHTYTVAGTSTVQLVVSGPGGVSTNTQPDLITAITPPPTASFSADPVAGFAPLTVTFTDSSTGTISSRLWDFGDGTTTNTTLTSVEHTYAAGTYDVELVVSGPSGSGTNLQSGLITSAASSGTGETIILSNAVREVKTEDMADGNARSGGLTGNDQGADVIRAYQPNADLIYSGILVFVLPDLAGETIASANLSIYGSPNLPHATYNSGVDLYSIRTAPATASNLDTEIATTDSELTSTYSVSGNNGTGIMDGMLPASTSAALEGTYETDDVADVALGAWIQAQYDAGAQPGDYIFLRLTADTYSAGVVFNRGWLITSADAAANRPELSVTLATSGPVPQPPRPVAVLGGNGSFGSGQDVISWNPVQGSGFVYSVWYSTNLMDGFQPLETNLADTILSITNTIDAPSVFYKIEAQ